MLAVHAAKTDIYFLIWHFLKLHNTGNTSALLSAYHDHRLDRQHVGVTRHNSVYSKLLTCGAT